MSSNRFQNTIVFDLPDKSRLHLKLSNAWVRSVGIGPDVNVATVSYNEWESIGDKQKLIGDVKFFYTAAPNAGTNSADVTLKLQEIIDVQPETYGPRADASKPPPTNTASLPVEILSYRITFADIRHKFAHPFGGRVALGELNKTPLTVGGNNDANGNKLYNPLQMASACLRAMGLKDSFAPLSLSDHPKLFDVQWRGNHAPTELEKVLKHTQHVTSVSAAGNLLLHAIGKGEPPVIPTNRAIAVLPFQAIERRGKSIILTSAPNANLETKTIVGPYDEDGDESWQFVIEDLSGKWVTYDQSGYFRGETEALARFQTFLPGVPEEDPPLPRLARNRLFRCIRLNPVKYGPSPLNRKLVLGDRGAPVDLIVTSKAATADILDVYTNPKEFELARLYGLYDEGRVIHSLDIFLRTDTPALEPFNPHARLLGNNDLHVRCTREVYEKNDEDQWVPKYNVVGYKQVLADIVEVTGADLQNLIDSGEAPIYVVPSLRLLTIDGVVDNADQVKALAINQANAFLSGSGDPAEIRVAKGFFPFDLNGTVSKIEYHQHDLKTVFHINTFFLPSSEALPRYQDIDAHSKTDAYPKQAEVSAARTSAGQSGSTQQTAMIQAWPPSPTPPGLVKVKITDISSAGRGKYNGGIVGGASTADQSSPLTEPEGMTDPATTNVLICNLAEDKSLIASNGPDHMLPVGYYLGKLVGGGTGGATVEIDSTRCGATSTRNIQHTDGAEAAYADSVESADRQSFQFSVPCRHAYNAAGDKTLYAFHRTFTVDCGKITAVGREQRVAIFTTGTCP